MDFRFGTIIITVKVSMLHLNDHQWEIENNEII